MACHLDATFQEFRAAHPPLIQRLSAPPHLQSDNLCLCLSPSVMLMPLTGTEESAGH